jgi:hypothetical protein
VQPQYLDAHEVAQFASAIAPARNGMAPVDTAEPLSLAWYRKKGAEALGGGSSSELSFAAISARTRPIFEKTRAQRIFSPRSTEDFVCLVSMMPPLRQVGPGVPSKW